MIRSNRFKIVMAVFGFIIFCSVAVSGLVFAETTSTDSSSMTSCWDGSRVPTGTMCPVQSEQSQCTTGNGKWCNSASGSGGNGWCSYSTSACPAYDTASCTAQNGMWCNSTGGGIGWCATNGATCPVDNEAACTSQARKWCTSSSSSGGGWCATSGSSCPATDLNSCTANGGEWCVSSYGGSNWCASTPGSCPVNDQATCTSKGRQWCPSTSPNGYGWCASSGGSCPSTTTPTTDSNMYTCADGTKVSNSSQCPTTPTTYTSWPSTQTDCEKYKGVWCSSSGSGYSSYGMSTYTGSCMMAGQACTTSTPTNMIRCWDDSTVPMSSSCPTTPSNQSDCTVKSGVWCPSTYGNGYCTSKSNSCPKNPPSGQMVCPDNLTFATKLTDCPVLETKVPEPVIQQKTCPDGSIVNKNALCPAVIEKITICPDGQKVVEGQTCTERKPIVDDPISTCLKQSGSWCKATESVVAYCASKGSICVVDKKIDPVVLPPLTANEIKLIERQKKTMLTRIDGLEKVFTRMDDKGSLVKTGALREKLVNLVIDGTAMEVMEGIKDEVALLQEVKNDLLNNGEVAPPSERDQQMQERALKDLQRNVPIYRRHILVMEKRVATLEKSGFVLPQELKDALKKGKNIVAAIKVAKTYDEARDSIEAFGELAYELNDWALKLSDLQRLNGMLKLMNREISNREKEFKRIKLLVQKLKVDVTTELVVAQTSLTDIRSTWNELKKMDYSQIDPTDMVQIRIIDQLENVDNILLNIQALANLKNSYNRLLANVKNYEKRIVRMEAKKQDTTELRPLLNEAKDHLAELKGYAGRKLVAEEIPFIFEEFQALDSVMDQLADLLQISTLSKLQKELLKKGRPDEIIEEIKIPTIENELTQAEKISTFYRRSATEYGPTRVSGIKIKRPSR
ncbi:MAG: hypothetical protein AAB390_02805 [Patescibacteria group bacterium]